MVAERIRVVDLVEHDHRPVSERHVLEAAERIDGRADPPDRAEVARDLSLQRRGDARELAGVDLAGLCDESHVHDVRHEGSFPPAV